MNYLKERDGDLFSNADLKRLIVPLLIEQLLAIAVGMADSIMVSSVGEAAVSSVSLIDTIFILLINMFTAIATGGAVVCGQYIGKKRPHKACEAADQLLLVTTALSVVIMAAVYLLKPFILHVVFGNITAEVERNCNIYLMIVAASIPFLAVYNGCAAIFRAQGDSKTPMKISIVMNLINISGNALLVYALKFGVDGVAIPTLLSRMYAAVAAFVLVHNKRYPVRCSYPVKLKPERPREQYVPARQNYGLKYDHTVRNSVDRGKCRVQHDCCLPDTARYGDRKCSADRKRTVRGSGRL